MNDSGSTSMSSDEKQAAVEQFCSFTGATEDRAKVTLEACNWNIELAVNMHVDGIDTGEPVDVIPAPETTSNESTAGGGGGGGSNSTSTLSGLVTAPLGASSSSSSTSSNAIIASGSTGASSSAVGPSTSLINEDDSVRPPIPPVRQVLVEDGFHPHRTRNHSQSVFDAFRNFRAETRWMEEGESASSSSSNLNKRRTLEELFRPPLDLMFRGTMDQARDFAARSNKWLMVNLQNVQEFACQVLNRDLWSNTAVKEIISEYFVFWQIYHDSYEGSKYMQFYNVMQFPYIAILDPRTGEKMRSWSNTIEPVTFCDVVTEFLMEHPSPNGPAALVERAKLPIVPKDKQPNPYEETEEMQLRAAIAASLEENHKAAADTSNNCKVDTESDESVEFETFDSDTETGFSSKPTKDSKIVKIDIQGDNQLAKKAVSCESWEKYLVPENGKTADIVIRFPAGNRERKSFPAESPLKILFLYISSKGFSMDDYDVMINFPKKNLKEFSETDTLSAAGLCPANTVFVQMKS